MTAKTPGRDLYIEMAMERNRKPKDLESRMNMERKEKGTGQMDWTEELQNRTGVKFLTTHPAEIEKKSFEIIRQELGEPFLQSYPKEQFPVLCRVIHTTADFSYKDTLYFTENVMERAVYAIKSGMPIITDTTMAASGINKRAAGVHGNVVRCFIGDEDVKERAKESGMTRSAVSVEKASKLYPECIYAVGNAPTALMRLYELIEEGKIRPGLVIGVPVGFVNVVEAKELILKTKIPAIVARGRKGGSNVAAAICNALLYRIGEHA